MDKLELEIPKESDSQRSVWQKLKSKVLAGGAALGGELVEQSLVLYYTLIAEGTPAWCRSVIIGALAYFISIVDGIPDITPILGYTDDASVMALAIATLATHITPEIREKARLKRRSLSKL